MLKVGGAWPRTVWEVECTRVCAGPVEGGQVSLRCFLSAAQPPGDHSDDDVAILPAVPPCPQFVYPNGKKRRRACGVAGCAIQAQGKLRTTPGEWGPAGGRCTFHGAERRKCCVHGRGSLGRRVCGPDNLGERGPRCCIHGGRIAGLVSESRQRERGAPSGSGGRGALFTPATSLGVDDCDPGYICLLRAGRRPAVGGSGSASGEGGVVSQKPGRRGMAKRPRRRRWFCAEDGRPNKAQKKDPADGLPKCYARGATRVPCTVEDCANQARGARAEEADSLGPAGRRCLAHSPGLVDLTADSVRIIKFDVHRLGTYWVESLRLW